MAKIVYRRVPVDGLEIVYREAGRRSAPAILLLHGFPAASHKENLTIREIARRISNAGTGPVMAGTAVEIADEMEAWHAAGAADGFNLMFPLLPDDWLHFVEFVAPELQTPRVDAEGICERNTASSTRPAPTGEPLQQQIVRGNRDVCANPAIVGAVRVSPGVYCGRTRPSLALPNSPEDVRG